LRRIPLRPQFQPKITASYRLSRDITRLPYEERGRGLIKKAPPRKECLDINAGIREVIELTRGESVKNGMSMQADLADGFRSLRATGYSWQQVILNLIVNAVAAMSGASDGQLTEPFGRDWGEAAPRQPHRRKRHPNSWPLLGRG
jgi:signal transduction histidine kinase